MHAILLVGGRGTRLLPYTKDRPKALMKLGRYPILEVIIRRLAASGFTRITLCVSHLAGLIRAEFGDGRRLGVDIDYSFDARQLGTAAPLLQVADWTTPAVVMNGDLLTTIDFAGLHRHHRRQRALLTVAFRQHRLAASVGLLSIRDGRIEAVWEKPSFDWNVCSGIYVADPLVRQCIPAESTLDMPDLMRALISRAEPVHGYPFRGAWHDIGTPERYQEASRSFLANPDRYLRPGGEVEEPVPAKPRIDAELHYAAGPETGTSLSVLTPAHGSTLTAPA